MASTYTTAAEGAALRDAGCEIPNLDCLSTDPADLAAAELIFARLAAIAGHTASAMRARRAGDVEAASASERAADNQYQQLPAWVRW